MYGLSDKVVCAFVANKFEEGVNVVWYMTPDMRHILYCSDYFPFEYLNLMVNLVDFGILSSHPKIFEDKDSYSFNKFLDYWDWEVISRREDLTIEFIMDYIGYLNHDKILKYCNIDYNTENIVSMYGELSK